MKTHIKKIFQVLDLLTASGAAMIHSAVSATSRGVYLASQAAVCMDAKTGEILYSKAHEKTMYPASTTKVMTALLLVEYALEHGFNEVVTASEKACNSIGRDASNIGLVPGDTLTLRECLYAIMLASANEVCVAAAEHIAGNVERFTYMMNERALSIGACATYFTNPHGLPDKNHVTTAYDIALIMREAICEPEFTDVIQAREYTVYPRSDLDKPYHLKNKNMLIQDGLYGRDYVIGGKTGYTNASRHTLVNYAEKNGIHLICVMLNAPNYMTYPDTIALFEYGFAGYRDYMLAEGEVSL